MKHTIYISGKITGVPDLNRAKFAAAKVLLKDLYNHPVYEVLNPHDLDHGANKYKTWDKYMRVCLAALTTANEVVVLDDWQQSRGAIIEVLVAGWLNIPIYAIENPTVAIYLSKGTKLKLYIKVLLNHF